MKGLTTRSSPWISPLINTCGLEISERKEAWSDILTIYGVQDRVPCW